MTPASHGAHAVAGGEDLNEVRIRDLRPFRHLPVSGNSGLAGIVDIADICQALIDPTSPGGLPPTLP